jgi:hypothetical protein
VALFAILLARVAILEMALSAGRSALLANLIAQLSAQIVLIIALNQSNQLLLTLLLLLSLLPPQSLEELWI